MKFKFDAPAAHTIDDLRVAQTVPLPKLIAERHQAMREDDAPGCRKAPRRKHETSLLQSTGFAPGMAAEDAPHVPTTWRPSILMDHEARHWAGQLQQVPDCTFIGEVPPSREQLWPKKLLSGPPMNAEIRAAVDTNLEWRDAVEEGFFHLHYARSQFAAFADTLRTNLTRRLPPLPERPALTAGAEAVPLAKLVEDQRNDLRRLRYNDDQYRLLMRDFERATNRWQQDAA
eukprot:GGOE01036955.1.p2 GENE.GGOE01036955.1~~GGOE01036955.1.p2  ORF type:complete len:230 (-),score=66.61 GGOE01036955.1:442-1131(-)